MTILSAGTVADIASSPNQEARMLLVEMQFGLTREKALESPPIFKVQRTVGERDMMKLMVFLLKSFQDSLKVKEQMGPVDIMETAEMILEQYTHDSLKDIILALKEAKKSGRNFYNSLSQSDVFDILHQYFDEKAKWLESRHRTTKTNAEVSSIGLLKGMQEHCPEHIENMKNMIDPRHINKDHLRLRLTIQKQKKKRGLT